LILTAINWLKTVYFRAFLKTKFVIFVQKVVLHENIHAW